MSALSASILRAQSLSKSVVNGIFDTEKTIASNKEHQKQEAAKAQERLQEVARARVRRNEEIVKGDEGRIFGTDAAIRKAAACIRSLQHARYSHYANSQVTDRRFQLRRERSKHLRGGDPDRPSTVAKVDIVHRSLEREHRILENARLRLQELEGQARAVVLDLEAVRGYLSQDAAKRRFSVELDRAYIISFGSVTAGGPLPSPPDIDEEGVVKALQMQMHVQSLEDRVQATSVTSAAEIKNFHQMYAQIHAQLEEELSKSTFTLGDLGKRLKGQAKDVDVTTRMAERSLGEIKKKNLTKGDSVGASKVVALESTLADLRLTREALQEDIRSKSYLLDIDERCRKVTTTGEKLFEERKVRTYKSAPNLRTLGQFTLGH